jgi:hypothetical protein
MGRPRGFGRKTSRKWLKEQRQSMRIELQLFQLYMPVKFVINAGAAFSADKGSKKRSR